MTEIKNATSWSEGACQSFCIIKKGKSKTRKLISKTLKLFIQDFMELGIARWFHSLLLMFITVWLTVEFIQKFRLKPVINVSVCLRME